MLNNAQFWNKQEQQTLQFHAPADITVEAQVEKLKAI